MFMNALIKNFRRLLHDECGQSTTEYILILAVVVMVAMKFKSQFQSQLTGAISTVGANINTALDSSAP